MQTVALCREVDFRIDPAAIEPAITANAGDEGVPPLYVYGNAGAISFCRKVDK